MMVVLDLLASGASSVAAPVIGMRDVRVNTWILADQPLELHVKRDGDKVTLFDASDLSLATATVQTGSYADAGEPPQALPAIDAEQQPSPYEDGRLFHGPAFQLMTSSRVAPGAASSILRADNDVPGMLNPALLDAATHGIPHDGLSAWFDAIGDDQVAYPALIKEAKFYGPAPRTGEVRCEVRAAGVFGTADYPMFDVQLIVPTEPPAGSGEPSGAEVWATLKLVEACFPKGPLGSAPADARRAFLRDRVFAPSVTLSTVVDGTRTLRVDDIGNSDWLPGTIRSVYGTAEASEIAQAEHIAAAHALHPWRVQERLPLNQFALDVATDDATVRVSGEGRGAIDLTEVRRFWSEWFDCGRWPVEDLYYGIVERFVDRVVLEDPDAFAATQGKAVLYLANHETAVESLLFSIVVSALGRVPTVTLAKAEHRDTWLGELIQHCFTYPGVKDPGVMTFFDRSDKSSLQKVIGGLAAEMASGERSVMVHVEGTRAFSAVHQVEKMSGAFIDMAMAVGAPIVPVRFSGGLTVAALDERTEFPVGMGKQTLWIGAPISPATLAGEHYGARKKRVIAAINGLGGGGVMAPSAMDASFAARANAWRDKAGVTAEHAVLRAVLAEVDDPCDEVARLLALEPGGAVEGGEWLRELVARLVG